MEIFLTPTEARILGCLMEKEMTTPEYYPLTLNSLIAACNQKSNRDPVVDFGETTVVDGLEGLRQKRLALRVDEAGSRVPKYRHGLPALLKLPEKGAALLCPLLLRGFQTIGELRQRTQRMASFADLKEIEEVLNEMENLYPEPVVKVLPLQPGKKERRYAHLLCGEPDFTAAPLETIVYPAPPPESLETVQLTEEIEELKTQIQSLENEITNIRTEFEIFKKQFD